MVLVLPSDLNTLTIPSMALKVPVKKFQSFIIIHENQIPKSKAMYTCLVRNASTIAIIGGNIDSQP